MEEVIENYGLAKLMDEVMGEETLGLEDAKKHDEPLKSHVEG